MIEKGRYIIHSSAVFVPVPQGVYLKRKSASLFIKGKSAARLFQKIGPRLQAGFTWSEISAELAPAQAPALKNIIEQLGKNGFLSEVRTDEIAYGRAEKRKPQFTKTLAIASPRLMPHLAAAFREIENSDVNFAEVDSNSDAMELVAEVSSSDTKIIVFFAGSASSTLFGRLQDSLRPDQLLIWGLVQGRSAMCGPPVKRLGSYCAVCAVQHFAQCDAGIQYLDETARGSQMAAVWLSRRLVMSLRDVDAKSWQGEGSITATASVLQGTARDREL
jgi:hypothetical protein